MAKARTAGDAGKLEIVTLDGKEPEAIVGASEVDGEVLFWVAWKGHKSVGVVRAAECNVKIPKLVIDFYETRIEWDDTHPHTLKELSELKIESKS